MRALALSLCLAFACGGSKPCSENRDCPAPQTCVSGRCASAGFCIGSAACADDLACGASQHCANGCCVPGTSGSCLRDADCSAHPDAPVCDVDHAVCVECLVARDCGAGRLCKSQKCEALPGCASNSDCSGTTPVCDLQQHACVECLASTDCHNLSAPNCDSTHHCTAAQECQGDTQCAKPTPKCMLPAGRCVACLAAADCPDPEVCDAVQNVCVTPAASKCTSEPGECATNTSAPHCKLGAPGQGTCVSCLIDAHCPSGEFCSANVCGAKACAADGDCVKPVARCDLTDTPHVCVACLGNPDCPSGGTCNPDHTCTAPANGCSVDADCAGSLDGHVCRTDTHTCVACVGAKGCASGEVCTPQNTCISNACKSDTDCASHPSTPHCDANGNCVACTTAAQCGNGYRCASGACAPLCTTATQAADCPPATPVCRATPYPACVQCVQNTDCTGGQICSSANVCVTPTTDCPGTACPAATPVCNTGVSPHTCVQCLADLDCKDGTGCSATHTCGLTGGAGQICNPDFSCSAGLLCIDENGPHGPVCRPKCNPYSSSCASGTVCSWLDFDTNGAFEGYCSAPNGHGAIGAACNPADYTTCELNLLCAPVSATAGVCRAVCDPAASGNCSGATCNGIAGAVSDAGVIQKFGYCGPASKWGQSCVSDTKSTGPDCGAAITAVGAGSTSLFCAPTVDGLLAEYPSASILPVCSFTPGVATAVGGAGDSCTQHTGADCRTGVCLTDGPATCFSGCAATADCTRDGAPAGTYCFDVDFATAYASNPVSTCEPTCTNDANPCTQLAGGGRTCVPAAIHGDFSWRAVCVPVLGAGKAGAKCAGGTDCASGVCVTAATLQAIELSQGVSGFTAKDGFCLGACVGATDCTTAGTVCSATTALPLSPASGNQGVMGAPHNGVCWPQTCTRDANCTGLSNDAATPRVCAPYKTTTSASTESTTCSASKPCASGAVCNDSTNNPNPGSAYGTTGGIYGPNGYCRQVSWALECAPSLGAAKLGPGETCVHSDDCRTGHCLVPSSGTSYCFGGCTSDGDCLGGKHCKSGSYLGMAASFCQP